MDDWVWINGDVVRMSEAKVGIEDRGFQFADGVYEVIRLYGGRPFRLTDHLDRLGRSAAGILVEPPLSGHAIAEEIHRLLEKSGVGDGMVYLQLTRGPAPRNHLFPTAQKTHPTLLFYARALAAAPPPGRAPGIRLLSVDDFRWKRCWIKSIALLPNILAKNAAVDAGADEAVFVDNGLVTECAASNFFAVIGQTVTAHPAGAKVLPGITWAVLREAAQEAGIAWDERPLTESEAMAADEAFITSTTREVSWVSVWNGKPWGSGQCGPVTRRLHEAFVRIVRREIGAAAMVAQTP